MTVLLSDLKHTDPREFGYRSAQARPNPTYFIQTRCADLSPEELELAVEGWNEYQEATGREYIDLSTKAPRTIHTVITLTIPAIDPQDAVELHAAIKSLVSNNYGAPDCQFSAVSRNNPR